MTTRRAKRYGDTRKFVNVTVSYADYELFLRTRVKSGLTKAEAVEEAIHLLAEKYEVKQ